MAFNGYLSTDTTGLVEAQIYKAKQENNLLLAEYLEQKHKRKSKGKTKKKRKRPVSQADIERAYKRNDPNLRKYIRSHRNRPLSDYEESRSREPGLIGSFGKPRKTQRAQLIDYLLGKEDDTGYGTRVAGPAISYVIPKRKRTLTDILGPGTSYVVPKRRRSLDDIIGSFVYSDPAGLV